MGDLDSTQALLDSTIPTPTIVDSVAQDSEEDEIFFGTVTDKEAQKGRKLKRRDTVCLSSSVSEWRKMNVKDMSRDSLLSLSSSSSNRRSSLLSQENSITEESEDDVFTEEHADMDTEEDMDEVEIAINKEPNGAFNWVLDWTTSDVVSVDNDISGVEPLETTTDTEHRVIEDQSRSCVYDSFSEDTGEESLDMGDTTAEEEAANKLEHAKRKILQDSTILSGSSISNDLDDCNREMEIISARAEEDSGKSHDAPQIIVTEASMISPDLGQKEVPDDLEEDEVIPNSPAVSEYFTAPSSRRQTGQSSISGMISPSFDTTAEEMALFEMFGEDYDEIVAAMTHQEKVQLGERIHGRDEAEIQAVAAKLKKFMEENNRLSSVASSVASPLPEASPRPSVSDSPSILPTSNVDHIKARLSIGSDVSPFSLASTGTNTPSPALIENLNNDPDTEMMDVPSPHQLAPSMNSSLQNTSIFGVISSGEDINLDKTPIFSNPMDSSLDDDKERDPEHQKTSVEDDENKTPVKSIFENPVQGFSNNFMLPTTSSLKKMVQSPSPRKPVSNPAGPVWLPPSPSPSKLSIGRVPSHSAHLKSPHGSSAKRPAAISRLPQLVRTPQRPAGLILSDLSNSGLKTPSSIQRKAAGLKSAYSAVASPVASYVRNNPAPHLVQNVKAKEIDVLESTLVEVEEKENSARLSLLPVCPLPSAVYKASSAMDEEECDDPQLGATDYEYVTEAYGAVTCSAKVTKHVARVKMPISGLTWNEDYLVNDESVGSSPSVAKFKQPAKSVLKMTRRDSGLFDESMMNVSVVETKVVKKVARAGRGRGRGKKK